ncbi:MAG: hypothetical protein ACD_76C00105G0007 [uncultured bacterium]|nr:MAG: hypothetical protein ACD_76C00105G0007 [uncultured bacterium]HBD04989.1 FAD synthase [Candidatus Uhrbacteria bacterium]
MAKALVFGTFDVLHEGHKFFLTKAKELADELIAVVALDEYVEMIKKKKPVEDQYQRMENVRKTGIANEVVLSDKEIGTYIIVKEKNPDVIAFGYDQSELAEDFINWIKDNNLNIKTAVIDPFHPEQYKSSLLSK